MMIGAIAVGTPSVTISARSVVNIRKLKVIDMKQTVEEAAWQELMSIHVQNVNIANIVTVIIQHSIVANVVQMNLKKDLLPVRTGVSIAYGIVTIERIKRKKQL